MTSTASSPRRRAPVVAGLVALVVLAVVTVLALTRDDVDPAAGPAGGAPAGGATPSAAGGSPDDTPDDTPLDTPLAAYDTSGLTVARAAFCDLVAPATVAAALGGEPDDVRAYDNGDRAELAPGVTDIAHEYGCAWTRGRTELRAWVFAPPVTPRDARRLVTAARGAEGCDVRRDAPAFGAPSLARTCPAGRGHEASHRGLFGDAWLSCSVRARGTRAAVLERAGAWCVEVAEAASQPTA